MIAIVEIGKDNTYAAQQIYDRYKGGADWYYYEKFDPLEISDLEEFYSKVIVIGGNPRISE